LTRRALAKALRRHVAPQTESDYASAVSEARPPMAPAAVREDEAGDALDRGLWDAPLTSSLIAVNLGVFAALVWLARSPSALVSVPSEVLRWLGANHALWTIADSRFETLVTSVFLHGSVLHLGFNLLVLWQVGPFLERAVGPARFLPLFLTSGMVGSACSAIWGRFVGPALSVGASGAVCGLIAAVLVLGVRTQGWRGPLAKQMGAWLGFLLLFGLAKNLRGCYVQVDNAAHVGGALAGLVIAASWKRGYVYPKLAARTIVSACVTLVMAAGAVVYVRDRTDPYLFLDHQERLKVAMEARRAGRCERARTAVDRALRMDPKNMGMQRLRHDIDRKCTELELLERPHEGG
jgi:rhomboid protease GluP